MIFLLFPLKNNEAIKVGEELLSTLKKLVFFTKKIDDSLEQNERNY